MRRALGPALGAAFLLTAASAATTAARARGALRPGHAETSLVAEPGPALAASRARVASPHARELGQVLAGLTDPRVLPARFVCSTCHGGGAAR